MAKLFKWLMVLLIPLFSLTITSCGGDDKDEPDNPTNTEIKSQTNALGGFVELWGSYPYSSYCIVRVGGTIDFSGSYIGEPTYVKAIYLPEAKSLSEISKLPNSGWAEGSLPRNEGGYAVQISSYGKLTYIRCWITLELDITNSVVGYTVKWQEFIPK